MLIKHIILLVYKIKIVWGNKSLELDQAFPLHSKIFKALYFNMKFPKTKYDRITKPSEAWNRFN
jgi:hypothetical protein